MIPPTTGSHSPRPRHQSGDPARCHRRCSVTTALSALSVLCFLGATSVAAADDGDESWDVYWKNGTRIESPDGDIKLKLGGRLMTDFSFASGDEALDSQFTLEDGSEFRRARILFEGTMWERFEFKFNYDFAGGDAEPKDVYLGLKKIPVVGNLRVGHFKEPFGLEELNSSKYISFLERPAASEAFAPSRNIGLMLHNQVLEDSDGTPRLTWAAGTFQEHDSSGNLTSNEWNLTGRLTALPLWRDKGRQMIHLGVGYSDREQQDDAFRFRARPGIHLAPRLVDTGNFAATGADLLGLEFHAIQGPFWAQAEIQQAETSGANRVDFSGSYVDVGYFLTGESRSWKTSSATIDRLKPSRDFLRDGGLGAWEIVLRWATIDLSDATVSGGEQDTVGVALNWYPNSAFRVMLNVLQTELEGVGDADLIGLRFQVDW